MCLGAARHVRLQLRAAGCGEGLPDLDAVVLDAAAVVDHRVRVLDALLVADCARIRDRASPSEKPLRAISRSARQLGPVTTHSSSVGVSIRFEQHGCLDHDDLRACRAEFVEPGAHHLFHPRPDDVLRVAAVRRIGKHDRPQLPPVDLALSVTISAPNASTSAAGSLFPADTPSWPTLSASITTAPCSASMLLTTDLPLAMLPVRPTTTVKSAPPSRE